MKTQKYITLAMLSLATTLLDTSFFSFIDIFEATILTTFLVLLVLVILNFRREALYFASFSILFFTIFSSVPIYLLFVLFFGIPIAIYLVKTKIAVNQENIFWVIIIFLVANFFFDLLLLVFWGEANANALTSLMFFTIVNTIFGLLIFYITKIIIRYFNIEIKEI